MKCDECALKTLKNGVCPIFNANMEGEKGCPYFMTELRTCEVCGNLIPKGGYIQQDGDSFHLMCHDCATGNPCIACKFVKYCALHQDDNCQEPLYVMVQHQKGNMVVHSQQLNPKRIQATCAVSCPCFREEGMEDGTFCWKQTGCGCNKNQYVWRQ